jgi:diguanylate cyclase (GGDEF)-like protein
VITGVGLRARDPRAAARSCVLILLVCAGVLCTFNLTGVSGSSPVAASATWVGVAVELVLIVLCARVRPEVLDRSGLLVAVGIGGVALICSLNLVTDDPSAAAQAFLALPVLWASVYFGSTAVVLITAVAVTGDAATLFLLVPFATALTDAVFFGAVLVLIAVMQTRANRTQDRLVAALHEQATVDALTGLANRRSFDEALGSVVRGSSPVGTAVVLIDIDRFKSINDAYGHPVGDAALTHVAAVLRDRVRAGDAVLARLGGDELAVLLPGCSASAAVGRAQDLLDAVTARPLQLADGTLVSLSLSIGVAHSSTAAGTEGLYSAADGALYQAKRGGRGRVATVTA